MFDRSVLNPNHETHIPVRVEVPSEADYTGAMRPDIPVPTLWQRGVKVIRKIDGREAVIRTIDLSMNMFRAHWLDTGEDDSKSTWQHCREFNVAVTLSPAEEERVAARRVLEAEISQLDATELAAVEVLVDDPDAAKALAKLRALRMLGVIKARPEAAQVALAEMAEMNAGLSKQTKRGK